ncbi:MAG: cupin domain-containing protein [Anaerolineales bacterium]|nr:cupin domain-containing protein [Anaerolineales bacterium]MDP2974900.1 cupin domain-containing protein [Anaerolineales bacterium]MDP3185224.1 cupin domain-containing protein [Anaerolineales bacterium]
MEQPKGKVIKGEDLHALQGGNSFAALLREEGDKIRRDVFMFINPEDSASGRIQSGITLVYPGCSTKGHSHPDREEVYFFISGRGFMGADGEQEWEVKAGDTFYVSPGPYHTARNPYDRPLEFFWITIKID